MTTRPYDDHGLRPDCPVDCATAAPGAADRDGRDGRLRCPYCRADWAIEHALPLRDPGDCGPALPLGDDGAARMIDAILAGARGTWAAG